MTEKVIEITPELNRRVQAERRREPRERIAGLERELEDLRRVALAYFNWNESEYQGNRQLSRDLSNALGLPLQDHLKGAWSK